MALVQPLPPQPPVGPARLLIAMSHAMVRLSPTTCGEYDQVLRCAMLVVQVRVPVLREYDPSWVHLHDKEAGRRRRGEVSRQPHVELLASLGYGEGEDVHSGACRSHIHRIFSCTCFTLFNCLQFVCSSIPHWITGKERLGGSAIDVDGAACGVRQTELHYFLALCLSLFRCARSLCNP